MKQNHPYTWPALRLIAARVPNGEHWRDQHNNAVHFPRGFERAIVAGFVALVEMADSYQASDFSGGDPIGTDGYAAPYFADMCRALIKLLSMDIGRLDGGTCEGAIRQLAADHGLNSEEL